MKNNHDNIITLTTDSGESTDFELLDVIYYEESEYAVLWPCGEEDESADVFIFRVEELDGKNDAFVGIDDERVIQAVFEIFKKNLEE